MGLDANWQIADGRYKLPRRSYNQIVEMTNERSEFFNTIMFSAGGDAIPIFDTIEKYKLIDDKMTTLATLIYYNLAPKFVNHTIDHHLKPTIEHWNDKTLKDYLGYVLPYNQAPEKRMRAFKNWRLINVLNLLQNSNYCYTGYGPATTQKYLKTTYTRYYKDGRGSTWNEAVNNFNSASYIKIGTFEGFDGIIFSSHYADNQILIAREYSIVKIENQFDFDILVDLYGFMQQPSAWGAETFYCPDFTGALNQKNYKYKTDLLIQAGQIIEFSTFVSDLCTLSSPYTGYEYYGTLSTSSYDYNYYMSPGIIIKNYNNFEYKL